mgnify:CR=1 FL=1
MKKLVAAFLSMMLAVCLSVSAVTLFASAASGTDLAVADDPTYTTTVDLKGENVADDFVAVFAAADGSVTAGKATDIWDYDAENGTFTSKESLVTNEDVWSDFYYLYYTGADYQNFYMEVTLTHQSGRAGWSGLAYGVQDVTKPAKGATENPFGGLSFVQGDGKYTWHNPKVNATEWNDTGIVATGFNGLTDTVHKLKVYDGHMQYWLNDEANVVVDVAVPEGGLTAGKVGIAVTNKAVAVKSIKITRLNDEGKAGSDGAEDIVIPESLQVTGITDGQNAVVGTPIAVSTAISPAGASQAVSFSSDPAGASYADGKLLFKNAGTYKLTFAAVENPAIKQEFTVNVSAMSAPEGYIHYELTEAGMARFETVFIAGGSGNGGVAANWSDYFTLENGELTRSGDSTGNVGNNYAALYFRNRTLKNFELIYTAKGNSSNGWFGAFFAMTDTTQAGNQNGAMAFMQNASAAKNATLWGGTVSGIGGPHEHGTNYVQNEWSTFKLRVVNGTIEFYVNDMSTPVLTQNSANDLTGRIALFADDGCAGAFKDVYLGILNDNGDVVPYKAVESVTIGNKQATAEVGDKIDLNVSVLPADATDASVEYDSSNPVVASIGSDGTVTCIMAGETTITVTSKEDPSKSDSFTLTVSTPSVPVSSVSITNKTDSAKVGDSLTLKVSVSPSNASDKSVTYASSDTSVATVEDGVVSFLKAGTVTITVKSVADPSKSDSFTVTVTEKEDPSENPGGDPGEDPTDPEPSGGCSSAVFGGSMALALVLAGGAAAVLRKKKH